MASPNSSVGDIAATTLAGYSGTLADNVTNHNALFRQINKKGNKQTATGLLIRQELEYATNATGMWYSGVENLSVEFTETFTAADYSYKQLAGNAVFSGLDEIQNSGKEAVHNLIKSRISNLEKSLRNLVATALYADGTGSNGKEIGGLQLIVADTNTNTVGTISGSTYSWWRNYVYDFSTNSVTASSTTIQHAMNQAWMNTIRGADRPDIITAAQDYFVFYMESLQANQRFTDDKGAGAGFTNLTYMGGAAPVIYDDQAPTHHMYFLNSDYLFVRPAKGREFIPLGEKSAVNQDALVMPIVWAGNMTCSNRARQAVVCA